MVTAVNLSSFQLTIAMCTTGTLFLFVFDQRSRSGLRRFPEQPDHGKTETQKKHFAAIFQTSSFERFSLVDLFEFVNDELLCLLQLPLRLSQLPLQRSQ